MDVLAIYFRAHTHEAIPQTFRRIPFILPLLVRKRSPFQIPTAGLAVFLAIPRSLASATIRLRSMNFHRYQS